MLDFQVILYVSPSMLIPIVSFNNVNEFIQTIIFWNL